MIKNIFSNLFPFAINLNHKEIFPFLSTSQKRIVAIAAVAFTALAICYSVIYLVRRQWNLVPRKVDLSRQIISNSPNLSNHTNRVGADNTLIEINPSTIEGKTLNEILELEDNKILLFYLSIHGADVKKLKIDANNDEDDTTINDKYLEKLVEYCPNLEDLHINSMTGAIQKDTAVITAEGMRHLSNLHSLENLNLGYSVTDEGMKYICDLPALKTLNLGGGHHITSVGFSYLEKLSSSLENLTLATYFDEDNSTNFTDKDLIHFAKLHGLKSLELCGCLHITGKGFAHFDQLNSLSKIHLRGCEQLNDETLVHLSKLPSLTFLDLKFCRQITDQGLKHLPQLKNLEYLNLMCSPEHEREITDIGMTYLANIPSLKYVYLANCSKITDQGLSLFKNLNLLEELNLVQCFNVTDNSMRVIATLPNLHTLLLGRCGEVSDQSLEYFKSLKNLKILELFDCPLITDDGIKHLESLDSLEYLDLGFCDKITDQALQSLSSLQSLKTLNLRRRQSNKKPKTWSSYKCFFRFKNYDDYSVHSIKNLEYSKITDQGLSYLPNLSSLVSLDLQGCYGITDAGVAYLTDLPLQELDLSYCHQITDQTLANFQDSATLKELQTIGCVKLTRRA